MVPVIRKVLLRIAVMQQQQQSSWCWGRGGGAASDSTGSAEQSAIMVVQSFYKKYDLRKYISSTVLYTCDCYTYSI